MAKNSNIAFERRPVVRSELEVFKQSVKAIEHLLGVEAQA